MQQFLHVLPNAFTLSQPMWYGSWMENIEERMKFIYWASTFSIQANHMLIVCGPARRPQTNPFGRSSLGITTLLPINTTLRCESTICSQMKEVAFLNCLAGWIKTSQGSWSFQLMQCSVIALVVKMLKVSFSMKGRKLAKWAKGKRRGERVRRRTEGGKKTRKKGEGGK